MCQPRRSWRSLTAAVRSLQYHGACIVWSVVGASRVSNTWPPPPNGHARFDGATATGSTAPDRDTILADRETIGYRRSDHTHVRARARAHTHTHTHARRHACMHMQRARACVQAWPGWLAGTNEPQPPSASRPIRGCTLATDHRQSGWGALPFDKLRRGRGMASLGSSSSGAIPTASKRRLDPSLASLTSFPLSHARPLSRARPAVAQPHHAAYARFCMRRHVGATAYIPSRRLDAV